MPGQANWGGPLDQDRIGTSRGRQPSAAGKYWSVNAFHVLGALFALWAITLAALGITREDFPRSSGQTLAVGTLSVLFALAAIGSGIITGALEEEEEEEGEAAGRPAAGAGARVR
jgi:hypothetical protein